MRLEMQQLQWCVGHMRTRGEEPAVFVPAAVPGAANLDWARAAGMPDWRRGIGFEQYQWMEDCWWLYRAELPKELEQPGRRCFFVTYGIDYEYELRLNGKTLLHHEGMYTPVEIELSGTAKAGDRLEVLVYPVPKDPQGEVGTRAEAAQCCKPAVSYGWDWHPRLIPTGLWEQAGLIWRKEGWLSDAHVRYRLKEKLTQALIWLEADVKGDGEVRFSLWAPDGTPVLEDVAPGEYKIESPVLWWCNGYGEPALYSWTAKLWQEGEVLDERGGRIGFRKIELVMNKGAWDEPKDFPMGRSPAPATLRLNGVDIFAKGSNWVNPEVFYGTITEETYRTQILLAKEAHFNIFRCWGGAVVNKEPFFRLCDEAGLMVWQEFPLACNNYRGTPEYLSVLEQEARCLIERLRNHACLVLWCGGNELFNSWSGMTDQSPALRLLNKLCYELDPDTPFLATSPLSGMGHGCYMFCYPDGREVFEVMPKAHCTAYTEFGVPSVSNREVCLAIGEEEELFPMEATSLTRAHHAYGAWNAAEDCWCSIETLRRYFGEPGNLDEMIDWSQWMQAEGYRCIYEEARRQKPYCSMAINWCYNEPWPTLANNSLINYPSVPKRSFVTVAAACRQVLASARIPKFAWHAGETFYADLWMLNDAMEVCEAGQVEVSVVLADKRIHLLRWEYPALMANTNFEGPTVRFHLPEAAAAPEGLPELNLSRGRRTTGIWHPLVLKLEAGSYSSEYRLIWYE